MTPRVLLHNLNNTIQGKTLHLEVLRKNLARIRGDGPAKDIPEDWVTDATIRFLEINLNEFNAVKKDIEELLATNDVQPKVNGV